MKITFFQKFESLSLGWCVFYVKDDVFEKSKWLIRPFNPSDDMISNVKTFIWICF